MSHETVADVLKVLLLAWLGVLALVVVAKMMRGEINTHGLTSSGGAGEIDPERVGLLALTLGIAFYYVIHTLGTPLAELRRGGEVWMLDVPEELLVALGGGQGAYLTGKVYRWMRGGLSHGQR